MSGFLSWLGGVIASIVTQFWRDQSARQDATERGRAESAAAVNRETADAERRMAEANARPRTRDSVSARLRDGDA